MKIHLYLLGCVIFLHVGVHAQMKIGDNSTSINSASLLELETTNKGLVFPRVSLTSVSSSSPLPATLLTGTVIYNTNASATNGNGVGLYYWNGTSWSIVTPNISSSAWGLTGNANTNYAVNFLGTTNNVSLRLRTNNTQRVIIDSLGKVGINTNSPSEKLDVSGNIRLSGALMPNNNAGTAGFFLMSSGANNPPLWFDAANYAWQLDGNPLISIKKFGSTTNFDIPFITNNIERMRLTAGGLLGIGTTNPGYALSISAVSNPLYLSGVQATATFNTDSVLTINAGIVKKAPYSSLNSAFWSLTGNSSINYPTNFLGTTDNSSLRFRTNSIQRMIIDSLGNVGIGLSNPSYALSVLSASNPLYLSGVQTTAAFTTDSLLTIYNGVVKEAPFSSLTNNFWGLTGNAGTNATNFIGTTDAIDFVAKTNNTDRIHILGAANGSSKEGWIGMGVSIPRSSLDVTGNYTNKNVLTIQNTSSSGYSSVDMLDNTGALVGTFGYGNSGTGAFFGSRDYFSFYGHDFVLNTNSGNYNFFVSGSSGNIGINTGSPSAKLDVSGNFKLGSSGTVLTNIYKTSVSITIPASASSFSVSQTVAVSNAPLNSSVIVNPRSALPSGVCIAYSYVSSANNVTVNFTGISAIALATVTFDITVMY